LKGWRPRPLDDGGEATEEYQPWDSNPLGPWSGSGGTRMCHARGSGGRVVYTGARKVEPDGP